MPSKLSCPPPPSPQVRTACLKSSQGGTQRICPTPTGSPASPKICPGSSPLSVREGADSARFLPGSTQECTDHKDMETTHLVPPTHRREPTQAGQKL